MEQSQEEFFKEWERRFIHSQSYDLGGLTKKFETFNKEAEVREKAGSPIPIDQRKALLSYIVNCYFEASHQEAAKHLAKLATEKYGPLAINELSSHKVCDC